MAAEARKYMLSPRRFFFTASVVASLALAPAVASAQPAASGLTAYPTCGSKTPDPDKYTSFYTVGRTHYDKSEFEEAIRYFNQAYEYDCTKHEILVIISRSHERLAGVPETKDKGKHFREAAHALEQFLERQKNDPEADTKKAVIEKLKANAATADKNARESAAATPPAAAPAGPKEKREHTVYPWVVTGVGGLLAVTGTVLYAIGSSSVPDRCELWDRVCNPKRADESTESYKQLTDDATSAGNLATAGLVTAGVGVAGVAGGLIWHFLEPVDEGAPKAGRVHVQPLLGTRERGLAIGGSF